MFNYRKTRRTFRPSGGLGERGGWPYFSHDLEFLLEADGQPLGRECGGALSAASDADATSEASVRRVEDLLSYPALAIYMATAVEANERKDEQYAEAQRRFARDHDGPAFLSALSAANQQYRLILRAALRDLREAIRKHEVLDEADVTEFWYEIRLQLEGKPRPAA